MNVVLGKLVAWFKERFLRNVVTDSNGGIHIHISLHAKLLEIHNNTNKIEISNDSGRNQSVRFKL